MTDAEARIKQDLVHAQAFAEARERPFHPTLLLIVDRRAPISVIDALARSLPVTMNYAQVVDLSGDGVPPAVLSCRCESVDVEALTAILWHSAGKKAPARRLLPLCLRQDRGARAVRLPANATGADLARLAEERAGRPFRLSLTPAG